MLLKTIMESNAGETKPQPPTAHVEGSILQTISKSSAQVKVMHLH